MSFARGSVIILMLTALAAMVPAAQATCSNATLNGVYGILSTGLNGALLPASSISRIVLDGAGNATGTKIKSNDGTIVSYTMTGTYQINSNCTGTAVLNQSGGGGTLHLNLVLNNANKGAFLIQTDANHVESSIAVALGSTIVCTNLAVKRKYSLELTGITPQGQSAMVGQLVLNGIGGISGRGTLSLYGSITNNVPVTGTYAINADCTGTAKITPQGLSPINLSLLVVNIDKEILALETDTGTIVAGTLQQ